jgi:16S rRNA (guanine(966)-N(2))-methyltransferase RsmD
MAFIAAGAFKRARLTHPDGDVRATQRFLRQSVFDYLADFIVNAAILDLFAGTGAFGIEALSRGAGKVVFVDISSKAVYAVKSNLEALGLRDRAVVYQEDSMKYLVKSARKYRNYDIIFLDPPFNKLRAMKPDEYEDYMIELIARAHDLLEEKSLIIMKYPKKLTLPLPSGVTLVETKDYGQNRVAFIAQTEYIRKMETAHDPGTSPS